MRNREKSNTFDKKFEQLRKGNVQALNRQRQKIAIGTPRASFARFEKKYEKYKQGRH